MSRTSADREGMQGRQTTGDKIRAEAAEWAGKAKTNSCSLRLRSHGTQPWPRGPLMSERPDSGGMKGRDTMKPRLPWRVLVVALTAITFLGVAVYHAGAADAPRPLLAKDHPVDWWFVF